jgi:hypothetical protein
VNKKMKKKGKENIEKDVQEWNSLSVWNGVNICFNFFSFCLVPNQTLKEVN